jgi:hypothetical protein
MSGAMATINDGVWTAIKHINAIFDEDQQRLISVPAARSQPSAQGSTAVAAGS